MEGKSRCAFKSSKKRETSFSLPKVPRTNRNDIYKNMERTTMSKQIAAIVEDWIDEEINSIVEKHFQDTGFKITKSQVIERFLKEGLNEKKRVLQTS